MGTAGTTAGGGESVAKPSPPDPRRAARGVGRGRDARLSGDHRERQGAHREVYARAPGLDVDVCINETGELTTTALTVRLLRALPMLRPL